MSRDVLKGVHRRALGIGYDDEVIAQKGFVSGGDGTPSIMFPSHDTVAVFDDFLGSRMSDTGTLDGSDFSYVEADAGYTGAVTTGTNGVFRVTGSTTIAASLTPAALTGGGVIKNWKPNSGGPKDGRLRMAARVKLETITRTADAGRTHLFVGFSDSGSAEMPAHDTGAGIISTASDCVGFLFSPGGDTGWSLVSARGTSGDSGDQLVVAGSSYGPTANVWTTLEVEVRSGVSDTGGTAHFWIDGKKVGAISSPVNSANALTPWVGGFVQDTGDVAGKYWDVDFIQVAAARDTGM